MSYLVQAWLSPAIQLPNEVVLPDGSRMRTVMVREDENTSPALLVEQIHDGAYAEADHTAEFRKLGQLISKLSFLCVHPFQITASRIVPSDLKVGDTYEAYFTRGPAPGVARFEVSLGREVLVGLDVSLLQRDLSPQTESAIDWLLVGLGAMNSIQQVLCHWIGLEALTPLESGPWQCRECNAQVSRCPTCDAETVAPATVRSIREYVTTHLNVSRKEFRELYELRCRIAHGGITNDASGIEAAGRHVFRIQDLLVQGIKDSLGWPVTKPPIIVQAGVRIGGTMGLGFESTVGDADFYDQPHL